MNATEERNGEQHFVLDERLGICVPNLERDWLDYTLAEQGQMIAVWEEIRARIPDRVKQLEQIIDGHQQQVTVEDDWDRVCDLYEEIYRIASVINDLNIWYSIEQHMSSPMYAQEASLAEEHFNREK